MTLKESGLAGTVGTGQSDDLVAIDGEVQCIEGKQTAEFHREIAACQSGAVMCVPHATRKRVQFAATRAA